MLTIAVKAGNDKVGKPAKNQVRSQTTSTSGALCLELFCLLRHCQATWTLSVFGDLDPSLPPKPLSVFDVGVKLQGPCLSSVSLSGFRVGFRTVPLEPGPFQVSCLSLGSLSPKQSHKVKYD